MPQSSSLGVLGTGSHETRSQSVPPRSLSSVVVSRVTAPIVPSTVRQTIPRTRLTLWNLLLFLFHAGLATLTLVVGKRDLEVPVYKSVIDVRYANESSSGDEMRQWELVPVHISGGTFSFTWWVASFFLLSAAFHLMNATVLRRVYLSQLEQCYTPTRWTEYFFSATVMIVIIAYTLGVRDRDTLISVGALVATTMTFGYWVEVVGRPKSADEWVAPLRERLFPWALGHVPQAVAWFLIIFRFYDVLSQNDRAPAFVYVILWTEVLLFFSFGVASLLSQLSPPRLFYRGEILFQILSLVSKGLLGGLLIANVLIYSSFDQVYTT